MKKTTKPLKLNKETLRRMTGAETEIQIWESVFEVCPPDPPPPLVLVGSQGASCYGSYLRPCCNTQTCVCPGSTFTGL